MDYNPEDTDVIRILKKLKEANGAYPQELLALRRQRYLNQVAEISGAVSLAAALKNTAKGGNGVGLAPAAGKVVEALLVVALVAEAGAVSYFYRDKLAQAFRSITNSPKVEQISESPVLPSPLPKVELTPSPLVTGTESVTPSPFTTETLTPVGTLSPEIAAGSTLPSRTGSTDTSVQTAFTQPATNDSGDNGNHYGQTPIPVRTKDSGNSGIGNQDNGNSNPNKKRP